MLEAVCWFKVDIFQYLILQIEWAQLLAERIPCLREAGSRITNGFMTNSSFDKLKKISLFYMIGFQNLLLSGYQIKPYTLFILHGSRYLFSLC